MENKTSQSPWQRAVLFAARRHLGQLRKDGQTPYFAHPVRVALTVCHVFGETDETALLAALLHDLIEDTTTDYDELLEEFGQETADTVAALSKDPRLPEEQREATYDQQLKSAPRKRNDDWRSVPLSGCRAHVHLARITSTRLL